MFAAAWPSRSSALRRQESTGSASIMRVSGLLEGSGARIFAKPRLITQPRREKTQDARQTSGLRSPRSRPASRGGEREPVGVAVSGIGAFPGLTATSAPSRDQLGEFGRRVPARSSVGRASEFYPSKPLLAPQPEGALRANGSDRCQVDGPDGRPAQVRIGAAGDGHGRAAASHAARVSRDAHRCRRKPRTWLLFRSIVTDARRIGRQA